MSTRCLIYIKDKSKYFGIYCHQDGDLMGVGKMLIEHYKTVEKVKSLIKLGSISYLGEHIPTEKQIKTGDFDGFKIFKGCTLPYSVRGEEIEHSIKKTQNEILLEMHDCMSDFGYIFENNQWFYATQNKMFTPLTMMDIKLEELEKMKGTLVINYMKYNCETNMYDKKPGFDEYQKEISKLEAEIDKLDFEPKKEGTQMYFCPQCQKTLTAAETETKAPFDHEFGEDFIVTVQCGYCMSNKVIKLKANKGFITISGTRVKDVYTKDDVMEEIENNTKTLVIPFGE